MDAFGYTVSDFIPCEICGMKANDIHHIDCRGMGGDPQGKKDVIENLQAICRPDHDKYGDKKEFMEMLYEKHFDFMEKNGLRPDYGKIATKYNAGNREEASS